MAKQWLIRYYSTEQAYKAGITNFTETVGGDRNFAINWAQNKIKHSQFKFYDIIEK